MTATQAATDANFDVLVLTASGLVLVDFWAPWCGPCKVLAPMLEDLAEDYGDDCAIVKVDVEANPAVAMRYGVSTLPSLVLFRDGTEMTRVIGGQSRAKLAALLDAHL